MIQVSPVSSQSVTTNESISIEEKQEQSTLFKIIAVVKNMLDILNDTSRQTQSNISEMKEKLKKLTEDQATDKKWLGLISVISGILSVVATFVCVGKSLPPEVASAATNALSKAASTYFEIDDFRSQAQRDLILRKLDLKTNERNNTSGLPREYKDNVKQVGDLYTSAAHG